jgi:Secretion system C-terminal sorting domain
MKNLKLYISFLTIMLLSIQNGNAVQRKISLSSSKSNQYLPSSIKSQFHNNDDGTIVCWLDDKYSGSLFVQKLAIGGEPVWTKGGITADINLGSWFDSEDDYPQMFSDNKGGAVIVYTKTFFYSKEIYVQKIFEDGSHLGRPICISSKFGGYNFSPSAVMNLENNIVVSWENFNGGDFDIHAQMLDLNCSKLWNKGNEIVVCDHPSDQRKPTIASDEYNNVYVCWLDTRDWQSGEFAINLYGKVLDKYGNSLEYGSNGKLIFEDNQTSLNTTGEKSHNKNPDLLKKEILSNHNLISSFGNSIIASFERSNYEDDSYIKICRLNSKLEKVWTRVIDDFYYQSAPLIISDNKYGANVFWDDQRNKGHEIFNMSLSDEGISIRGDVNGRIISCDDLKSYCNRIMPSKKNQNGLYKTRSNTFFTWVVPQTNKLYLSNLSLTDESNYCSNVIELVDGISEGEYTSVTTQRDNLAVVYKQATNIFALIMGTDDNSTKVDYQKPVINNFPNPFNPSTKITYSIPSDGFVKLSIFDITGREIKLLTNEFKTAGMYNINFDGKNYPSGIYFYRLTVNGFVQTKKMTLIK